MSLWGVGTGGSGEGVSRIWKQGYVVSLGFDNLVAEG